MWEDWISRPLHSPSLVLGFACITSLAYTVAVTVYGAPVQGKKVNKSVKTFIVPAHNFVLIVWSLGMHLALWKCIFDRKTWRSIACESTIPSHEPRSSFEDLTLLVLLLSKYYELFDTAIHFALNHEISFLHTFHHAVVLLTTSTWYLAPIGMVLYGALFNTGVHVIMYTYYLLSSLGIRLPKMGITMLQIVQFMVSMVAFIYVMYLNFTEGDCGNMALFYLASAFNAILLGLFIQLLLKNNKAQIKKH